MTQVRRTPRALAICIAATVALLAADLATKEWATETLSAERPGPAPPVCQGRMQRLHRPDIVIIDGIFELQYAENCGAAFGIGNDWSLTTRRIVFIPAAVLAAVGLLWMFARGTGGPLFAWSVPFVVSGAVGNLVDRIRYGYVVDFIRIHWYDEWNYPTFNVADIAIVVGVALLLLDGMRKEGKKAQAASEAAGEDEDQAAKKGKRGKKRDRAAEG
ncbi:MAG TPA: signal peptidase II [Sandaracinaceae bacterium]